MSPETTAEKSRSRATGEGDGERAAPPGHELIVCGWDEVFILGLGCPAGKDPPRKIWSWKAADCIGLPEDFRNRFNTTDECKPFDNGGKLLITSSGGAVAYVDRKTKRALFHGRAENAHSADLLPNGRIAVASSVDLGGNRCGDRLVLFEIGQPDQALFHEELPAGHGVVWDEDRQLLWALSFRDIRVFRLADWDTSRPKLARDDAIPLPGCGGHDLHPIAGTSFLSVTGSDCWLFDRETRKFSPHPQLSGKTGVKCISQNPVTKQIAHVKSEDRNWWAENIHFLNPGWTYHVPGEHFYKVRWNVQKSNPAVL